MPSSLRHFRRLLIALAAIFAASFVASDASACSAMKQGMADCGSSCGCCTGAKREASPARAEAEVARPVTVLLLPIPRVGCPAPVESCSCCSRDPAVPQPRPARSTAESRPEVSKGSVFVESGEAFVARTALAPQVPATQSPPRAPLYLQNERLLF
jgi:hypothetical protein